MQGTGPGRMHAIRLCQPPADHHPLPPPKPSRELPTFLSLFPLPPSSHAPATQNISVLTGETSSVSIQQIVQLGMFSIITYAV